MKLRIFGCVQINQKSNTCLNSSLGEARNGDVESLFPVEIGTISQHIRHNQTTLFITHIKFTLLWGKPIKLTWMEQQFFNSHFHSQRQRPLDCYFMNKRRKQVKQWHLRCVNSIKPLIASNRRRRKEKKKAVQKVHNHCCWIKIENLRIKCWKVFKWIGTYRWTNDNYKDAIANELRIEFGK